MKYQSFKWEDWRGKKTKIVTLFHSYRNNNSSLSGLNLLVRALLEKKREIVWIFNDFQLIWSYIESYVYIEVNQQPHFTIPWQIWICCNPVSWSDSRWYTKPRRKPKVYQHFKTSWGTSRDGLKSKILGF